VPVLIDATQGRELYANLSIPDSLVARKSEFTPIDAISLPLSRTTVAVEELDQQVKLLGIQAILNAQYENMFSVGPNLQLTDSPNDIPMRISLGQAIGAVAGYCAFFDTKADKIDVR